MEDNKLVVKNLSGEDITINVVDIISNDEGKKYICYTLEEYSDIFISLLNVSEDSYSLDTITDEERQAVEEVLKETLGGNNEV